MIEGPAGKYMFGLVKVGEKGQIVIPKDARNIFDINPGDSLLLLGDIESGLALVKPDVNQFFSDMIKNNFSNTTLEKKDE